MIVNIKSEFQEPEKAKRILEPESVSDNRRRSKVDIRAGKNKLAVNIKASDVNAARAATNTYLKLIGLMKKIGDI